MPDQNLDPDGVWEVTDLGGDHLYIRPAQGFDMFPAVELVFSRGDSGEAEAVYLLDERQAYALHDRLTQSLRQWREEHPQEAAPSLLIDVGEALPRARRDMGHTAS